MRLSPSFRGEAVLDGVRRGGGHEADENRDASRRAESDFERPDDEAVALREDEERERPH